MTCKSSSKSVCFFTGSQSLYGGTERACADTANALSGAGYEVTILSQFSGTKSGYALENEVKLKELFCDKPKGILGLLLSIYRLYRYIKSSRPDYVVAVESLSFVFVLGAFFIFRRPVIINWEHFNGSVDLGLKTRRVARYVASRLADHVVVLSDWDKAYWIDKLECKAEKLTRIYNINPFAGINSPARRSEKQAVKIVMAVGRLTYQKGFDILINAWALMPDKYRSGWELHICGEGPDRIKLEELIHHLGLSHVVFLIGHVPDIKSKYSQASLFVLSSRFEGFGLVVLEALSFGLPVVSFDCPAGPGEIIRDEIDGVLVSEISAEALSHAVVGLIGDEKKRSLMAQNAMDFRPQFSRESISSMWVSLFQSLSK